MLSTLNDGLKRAGQQIGFAAQISISGLPTLQDVDDAGRKLDSGAAPFTEVMAPFDPS
jgi:hypothetical protein